MIVPARTRPRGRSAALSCAVLLASCAQQALPPVLHYADPTPARGTPPAMVPVAARRGDVRATFLPGTAAPAPATRSNFIPAHGDVTLNFRGADAAEVARAVLGGILGVQYAVTPGVAALVTLATPYPVARGDVLRLFEDALRQANLALVPQNGIFQITQLEAAKGSAPLANGAAGFERDQVQLQFVSADELKKLLDPILPGVVIAADPGRNMLTIAGTTGQRAAVRDLVKQFDVNWLRGVSFALFVPQRTDARLIVPELDKLLNAPGAPTNGLVRLIAMERLNGILAISSQPQYLQDTRRFVDILDREGESAAPRMFLYHVQNGRAADLAKVILTALGGGGTVSSGQPTSIDAIGSGRQIGGGAGGGFGGSGFGGSNTGSQSASGFGSGGGGFGGTGFQNSQSSGGGRGGFGGGAGQTGGFGGAGGVGGNPLNNISAAQRLANPAQGQGGAQSLALNATITADESTNSILVYGTSRDYAVIEDALRQLDTPPAQVLIEAAISEVTLTSQLRYGLQTIFQSGRTNTVLTDSTTSTLVPSTGTGATATALPSIVRSFPGFSFLYANSDISAVLNALEGLTKVNVLSSPKLLVINNESASLQVGSQVPVSTGSVTSGLVGGITNSIDYRDTGVILKITPRVNAGGLVLLDIAQEVSAVQATSANSGGGTVGGQSPTFTTRRIATSIAIQDGETIALGGLISDSRTRGRTGIPFLSRIPIIGPFLFGETNNSTERTELLILLRPRVIRTVDDGRAITEELRQKIQLVPPFKRGQTLP